MDVNKRKKIARIVSAVGFLFLLLGFIPGLVSYQMGVVLFVFTLVISGLIMVAVPDPDPEIKDESGEE